jgi:hypothetical protein
MVVLRLGLQNGISTLHRGQIVGSPQGSRSCQRCRKSHRSLILGQCRTILIVQCITIIIYYDTITRKTILYGTIIHISFTLHWIAHILSCQMYLMSYICCTGPGGSPSFSSASSDSKFRLGHLCNLCNLSSYPLKPLLLRVPAQQLQFTLSRSW